MQYNTNNPIIKHKVGLLNLAEELKNISHACKIMGLSRDTFYAVADRVPLVYPWVSIAIRNWFQKAVLTR